MHYTSYEVNCSINAREIISVFPTITKTFMIFLCMQCEIWEIMLLVLITSGSWKYFYHLWWPWPVRLLCLFVCVLEKFIPFLFSLTKRLFFLFISGWLGSKHQPTSCVVVVYISSQMFVDFSLFFSTLQPDLLCCSNCFTCSWALP